MQWTEPAGKLVVVREPGRGWLGHSLAGATVAITLIVTKSFDENFNETGEQISMEDWLAVIERDPALTLRTQPHVTRFRDGRELSVPVLPARSELTVSGQKIPFLGYRGGELVMKLTQDMESPGNPKREKVAEVARQLRALITHDADDEILNW